MQLPNGFNLSEMEILYNSDHQNTSDTVDIKTVLLGFLFECFEATFYLVKDNIKFSVNGWFFLIISQVFKPYSIQ